MNGKLCPACGKDYSATCPLCRERTPLSLLKILGTFPWPNHQPVWRDRTMAEMYCARCGLAITPEMTMRQLVGPCSGSPEARAEAP